MNTIWKYELDPGISEIQTLNLPERSYVLEVPLVKGDKIVLLISFPVDTVRTKSYRFRVVGVGGVYDEDEQNFIHLGSVSIGNQFYSVFYDMDS